MEQIREKLDNLTNLSSDELASLKQEIIQEYQAAKESYSTTEGTDATEVLSTVQSLSNAYTALNNEIESREDAAAEVEEAFSNADNLFTEPVAETVEESDEDSEDEVEEDDESEIENSVVVEDEEIPNEEEVKEIATEVAEEVVAEEAPAAETPVDEEELSEAEPEKAEEDEAAEPVAEESEEAEEEDETLSTTEEEPESEEVSEDSSEENDTPEQDKNLSVEENTVTASSEFIDNERSLEENVSAPVTTITASVANGSKPAGSKMTSSREVAELFTREIHRNRATKGTGEQVTLANIATEIKEDSFLKSSDSQGNSEKISAVLASGAAQARENGLVAAGGLYAPTPMNYDIFSLGEVLDRPVKDALPTFNADRGGVRFLEAPSVSDLEGSVALWTLEDDEEAADEGSSKTKPCIRVKAGEEISVNLDAITLCVTFGNIGARTYPELVERHLELAHVLHARFAETRLITRIGSLSTSVTATAELGVARDVLGQAERVVAQLRAAHRLDEGATFVGLLPVWLKNAMRADIIKQIPGDGVDAAFKLADAQIDQYFVDRGIRPVWFLDGEAGQIPATQAEGTLNEFPDTVVWYVFPEGTFLFLDGGELDLGLVRDSVLNGTNDYKVFLETFEAVAKVGPESLRITSDVLIAGATAETVPTTA